MIGVMPPNFLPDGYGELWVPYPWGVPANSLRVNVDPRPIRDSDYLDVWARLKPGVRLTVTEGSRPVAHGEVYGVRMVEWDQLPIPFSPETTNFRPGQKTAS